jgi:hypothetical protein
MLRKSVSQPISSMSAMPGDTVRIIYAGGASIGGIPQFSRLLRNAFGTLRSNPQGGLFIEPHELMPNEIRPLGNISVESHTTVERITMDHPGEAAFLAMDYLQVLGSFIKQQLGDNCTEALMTAQMTPEVDRILPHFAAAGIKVVKEVEQVVSEKITYHFAENAEALKASIDAGNPVSNATSFAFAKGGSGQPTKTTSIVDGTAIRDLFFTPTAITTTQHGAAAQQPGVALPDGLSPFMRQLMGLPSSDGTAGLNLNDFGDIHDDDDDRPLDHPGM